MHTTLSEVVKEINEHIIRMNKDDEDHKNKRDQQRRYLEELRRQQDLIKNGIRMEMINLGEHVLDIKMVDPLHGDDGKEIEYAINDLTHGGEVLRTRYLATKNYDRWSHQGCGPIEYGYGPKHGSVVFSIGMQEVLRKDGRDLTNEEIDASIYLLMMLKDGKYFPPSYKGKRTA